MTKKTIIERSWTAKEIEKLLIDHFSLKPTSGNWKMTIKHRIDEEDRPGDYRVEFSKISVYKGMTVTWESEE